MYSAWDLTLLDSVAWFYKPTKPKIARLVRREPVGDSVGSLRTPCLLARCACTGPSSPINCGAALAAAPRARAQAQVVSH